MKGIRWWNVIAMWIDYFAIIGGIFAIMMIDG